MQKWKTKLLKLAKHIDDVTDEQVLRLRQRLGSVDAMQVVPYRTYGTPTNVYVRGRVLEDKKIAVATDTDKLLTNLLNMYKRFETDEVPGATVQLQLPDEKQQAITDKEGYFVFNHTPANPLITQELYHNFPLELLYPPGNGITVDAEMMIPPADAEYGIISDIDDTIIRSNATSLMAMGRTVLMGNARTRLPFAGVSAFYKALQLGRNGKRNNPFFYVSSSPWNLYDLLVDFMDHNEIPAGPLLLRDFGIQSDSFTSGDYLSHKFKEIAQILDTYPHLNFVLAGDSGEQDPPIYYEIVKKYPGRIICIYIRDVTAGPKKDMAQKIASELKGYDVAMILTEHTVKAAEHAASTGLIYREEIPAIVKDKKEDTGQVAGKEETAVTGDDKESEIRNEK
jgi:phosphatidate phosphatase APP1